MIRNEIAEIEVRTKSLVVLKGNAEAMRKIGHLCVKSKGFTEGCVVTVSARWFSVAYLLDLTCFGHKSEKCFFFFL